MARADATERIWLLILLHRIDQAIAEGEAMMTATADPFRSSMLLAQAYQRAGRFDDARRLQSAILLTTTGTAREAVVRQHIGKRLVDEGHWPAALDQFEQALQLWVAGGADSDLIESSVLAIRRTREVLSRGTGNPGAAGRSPQAA